MMVFRRSRVALGVLAAGLIAAGVAVASTTWKVQPSPNRGGSGYTNDLYGAAATSSDNAWAVGAYIKGAVLGPIKRPGASKIHYWRALIEHWNGKHWALQQNPSPRGSYLNGVAAASAHSAWAVGFLRSGPLDRTLIQRWDGKAWKTQKSVNPGGAHRDSDLYGAAATSPDNAWAVGAYDNGTAFRTLVEHWNGKAWKTQKSPNPSGSTRGSFLDSVGASSNKNAWAVGSYDNGSGEQTLIEHWNGNAWKTQMSPSPGLNENFLDGVAATSPKNAWAVGFDHGGGPDQTLIEHWDGHTWTVQPSINPGGPSHDNLLLSVTATSAKNAWAVGWYYDGTQARTIVEHWNGTAWKLQSSPDPSAAGDALYGVAASSARSVWAVGERASGIIQRTLAEHGS